MIVNIGAQKPKWRKAVPTYVKGLQFNWEIYLNWDFKYFCFTILILKGDLG